MRESCLTLLPFTLLVGRNEVNSSPVGREFAASPSPCGTSLLNAPNEVNLNSTYWVNLLGQTYWWGSILFSILR
uniref:Uncharacterized protein n=1 Tax=Picea glauca TaxID=3330 RepID=A0A117NHC2_PICGL|nr:hypothetical protein ABT39_MTgene5124 [Picea glauca]